MSSRGARTDLDDAEAELLIKVLRKNIAAEWATELPDSAGEWPRVILSPSESVKSYGTQAVDKISPKSHL